MRYFANIMLAALVCYNAQDLQTAYQVGKREGTCQKHCFDQGKSYTYNRKTKKCGCVEMQDEDDVYKPALLLSMPLQSVTMTGGSRSDNDTATTTNTDTENKTLIPVQVFNPMILR